MKGTPFKTRRISPFMQADSSLGGGQVPIDPNAGEGSVDPKVGRVKQSDIDYSKGGEKVAEAMGGVENVANFAPVSGEIIDAKNTIKDLIKGEYGGAALNAAGFMIPFIPGSVVKGGVKKIMDYIRKQPGAEEAMKKGEELMSGSPTAGQMSAKNPGAPTGVNSATGYKYDMDVLDVENPIPSFTKADLDNVEIPRMKKLGQALDASNFDVSTLTKDNIAFKGRSGGRTIVEIDLGNGQKQLFYKSTGSAKKSGGGVGGTTEGLWQPYAGHSNSAGSKGWFGKDAGYEDWYKSKSFNGISGNLDKLATEKGINLNLQMNDSVDKTFEAYRKRVGADQADIANIQ
tara:strand:+ start:27 stop:1058 length:1032 start_codon:yes stop_codon:yes gene_type:complete